MQCRHRADGHSENSRGAAKSVKISILVASNLVHEMVDSVDEKAEKTLCIVNVDDPPRDEVIDRMMSCKVWCWLAFFVWII